MNQDAFLLKNRVVKLHGRRTQKGLYTLDMRVRMPEFEAEVCMALVEDTIQLRHE